MAPRKPIAPLRAADCQSCGWRSYPRPVQDGEVFKVEWTLPERCDACGASLAAQTQVSAPGTPERGAAA